MGAKTAMPHGEAERMAFEALRKIIAATTEIFGEDVHVKESCDPEFPEEKYVVFSVSARGNAREIVAQEAEWVRRVRDVAPAWDAFRLSIRPTA